MVSNFQPTNTEEWLKQRNKDIALLQRRGTQSDLGNSGSIITGLLDESYRGNGPALVTFEGFPTISTNTFEWLTPYQPTGSRTVTLMRINGTWKIMAQSSPNRRLLPLTSNWLTYAERNNTEDWKRGPWVDLLPSGVVVLSGLIQSKVAGVDNELLFTLPPGYRPDGPQWLAAVNQADSARFIKILANGEVRIAGSGWTNNFVALDGIAFPAAGVATWLNIGSESAIAWVNTWGNYDVATYGSAGMWLDPYGFVWTRGVVSGGSFTDGTNICVVPVAMRAYAQHHIQTGTNGGYGMVGTNGSPYDRLVVKGGAAGTTWLSLFGAMWVTPAGRTDNPWRNVQYFSNTWAVNSGFTTPSTLRREDGLCVMNGFIASGTLGAMAFTLDPEVAIPNSQGVILTTGANSVRGRIDLKGVVMSPAQGSNLWFSLDTKVWMAG